MPVRQVGKDCYQWGNQKKYCGPGAKQKATLQGIAIENTGWKEAEDSKRYLRGVRGGQLSQLRGVGKIYPAYEDLECSWAGCNKKMREVQDFHHPSHHCVNENGMSVSAVNRLIRAKMTDTIKDIEQTYEGLNLPSATKQERLNEEKESVERVFSEAMRRNEENWKYILCDEHIENTESENFGASSSGSSSPITRRGYWRKENMVPIFCGMMLAAFTFRNR